MPLMTTCLGRLGSRYSIILDPIRRTFHYGALGMLCQNQADFEISIKTDKLSRTALPFTSKADSDFQILEQDIIPTSVVYRAYSEEHGLRMTASIIAPFRPRDEKTSIVPAYIINIKLEKMMRVRAKICNHNAGKGKIRFALNFPGLNLSKVKNGLQLDYNVQTDKPREFAVDGFKTSLGVNKRKTTRQGKASDRIVCIDADTQIVDGGLEVDYDLTNEEQFQCNFVMAGYCDDALFEGHGRPMKLRYTQYWKNADEIIDFVSKNIQSLTAKSEDFDRIWADAGLGQDAYNIISYSLQNYLMNTLWAAADSIEDDWFSVWEGGCRYNSTIDVTYNEAMFYFTLWPELLEKIFHEWSFHANISEKEIDRINRTGLDYASASQSEEELNYPGVIMEHDMGAGWTANEQNYPHAMPVEENSNFLLLLYAHACWWGKSELFDKYGKLVADIVDYLLWADSTGNGFPDRGRANTLDDSSPAQQYGRDNVYLGVKRMAALHAASRIFEHTGDKDREKTCKVIVDAAIDTLQNGYLGDHWGICLDGSAKGLRDCLTGEELDNETLQGWDDYHIFTANGLLYLLMVDDVPEKLNMDNIKEDLINASRKTMGRFGSTHQGKDNFASVWISANIWRDIIAGYLGENMLQNAQKYWTLQINANTFGSDNTNCFTECDSNNKLILYPRAVDSLGWTLGLSGLVLNRLKGVEKANSQKFPTIPRLPLMDWQ